MLRLILTIYGIYCVPSPLRNMKIIAVSSTSYLVDDSSFVIFMNILM